MLKYSIISPSRFNAVIDHLRVNFPDEPLNASVGLCLHGIPCPLLVHHDLKSMEDGLSIMVVDEEKQTVTFLFLVFCTLNQSVKRNPRVCPSVCIS